VTRFFATAARASMDAAEAVPARAATASALMARVKHGFDM
jgi:hypothetical protein